jgi:hypothetical protein
VDEGAVSGAGGSVNALGRDIAPGEPVTLKREGRFADLLPHERRFICDAGPGLLANSRDTRIVGRFGCDGYETEISGMEIDAVVSPASREGQGGLLRDYLQLNGIWPGITRQ